MSAAAGAVSTPGLQQWWVGSRRDRHARIFVRARGPRGGLPVVLVHGFFQPASAILDVPGYSLQQALADAGLRVVLFDLRGYGRSSRPDFMKRPPRESSPSLGCLSDALADIGDVVDLVCRTEGCERVDLLGYSWGTARGASFCAAMPGRVRRLVLYAPVWRPATGAAGEAVDSERPGLLSRQLGGYRVSCPGDLARQWDAEIESNDASRFRDTAALQAAERALLDSDAAMHGRGYRAPLGPMVDALRVARGMPLFDAARIPCDVLLVRGDCDSLSTAADVQGLLEALGTPNKRLVTVAGATHLLHLEHARHRLLSEVTTFLAAAGPS